MAEGMNDIFNWYSEIPLISRVYLTAALGTSCACALDMLSPFTLYYNYDLIVHKQQFWRIFSSFVFLGSFSLDFLFHLYFVVRYCRLLEEGQYRNRKADFIYMLIFGAICMLFVVATTSLFSKMKFLGHPFGLMMVCVTLYMYVYYVLHTHLMLIIFLLHVYILSYTPTLTITLHHI